MAAAAAPSRHVRLGERGHRSRVTGELAAGPMTLSEDELEENRTDLDRDYYSHPLDDEYYAERNADLSKIDVPLLSCTSWAGQPLHPRGNYVGYLEAGSK